MVVVMMWKVRRKVRRKGGRVKGKGGKTAPLPSSAFRPKIRERRGGREGGTVAAAATGAATAATATAAAAAAAAALCESPEVVNKEYTQNVDQEA